MLILILKEGSFRFSSRHSKLIFRDKEIFDDFVDGDFEFGGHADAAAKSNEKVAAAGGEMYIE